MDKYIFGIILKNNGQTIFEPIRPGTMEETLCWMQTVMNMSAIYKKLESNAGYFMMPAAEFQKIQDKIAA